MKAFQNQILDDAICGDIDALINTIIQKGISSLYERKIPILQIIINNKIKLDTAAFVNPLLQNECNKLNPSLTWILNFGLRHTISNTELVYLLASEYGRFSPLMENSYETFSIHQLEIFATRFYEYSRKKHTQRPDPSIIDSCQNYKTIKEINCTITQSTKSMFDILDIKRNSFQKSEQETPIYLTQNLLRTWPHDQRSTTAWRFVAPINQQQVTNLRMTMHFCYNPIMFDSVEILFDYRKEQLFLIDCSSVNDLKIELSPGKSYILSNNDVIQTELVDKKKSLNRLFTIEIYKRTASNAIKQQSKQKMKIKFRDVQAQITNQQSHTENIFSLKALDQKFQELKQDGDQVQYLCCDKKEVFDDETDQQYFGKNHFTITCTDNEVKKDHIELKIQTGQQQNNKVYWYCKNLLQLRRFKESAKIRQFEYHNIVLQNRYVRDWKTTYYIS